MKQNKITNLKETDNLVNMILLTFGAFALLLLVYPEGRNILAQTLMDNPIYTLQGIDYRLIIYFLSIITYFGLIALIGVRYGLFYAAASAMELPILFAIFANAFAIAIGAPLWFVHLIMDVAIMLIQTSFMLVIITLMIGFVMAVGDARDRVGNALEWINGQRAKKA